MTYHEEEIRPQIFKTLYENSLWSSCGSAQHAFIAWRDEIGWYWHLGKIKPTRLFVAKDGAKIVGWCMIVFDKTCQEEAIWAYVDARYRRQKIGTELVNRTQVGYQKLNHDSEGYRARFWAQTLVNKEPSCTLPTSHDTAVITAITRST